MLSFVRGIVVAAERNSAAPALITGNRIISFAELLDSVARISNFLVDRGLPKRSKLFINIADPDLRLIVMIAAMHCGMVPFALLEIGELKDEVDYDFIVGAAPLHLPALTPDVMIDQAVFAGRLSDGRLREFEDLTDSELLFIGSTTGTTGRPKLVAVTWGLLRKDNERRSLQPGIGDQSEPAWMRVSNGQRSMMTLGDVTFAGVGLALLTLQSGATYVRASRDLTECVKLINAYSVTRLGATPGTLAEIMDRMDEHRIRCPSIQQIGLVGSLFDRALLKRVEEHFDAEVTVSYGASEIGAVSAGVVHAADFQFGYVGEPLAGVRLVTTGSRTDPSPLVVVRDPETYLPYYSGGKLVPNDDHFYTLPDLGYAEDGKVYLIGRSDEVVNISGNKVAFSRIDANLRALPGVRDIAIVSALDIGDASGVLIGIVADADVDLDDLHSRTSALLKAPKAGEHVYVFEIDAVPRNAFGKTDRQRVVEAFRRSAAERPRQDEPAKAAADP